MHKELLDNILTRDNCTRQEENDKALSLKCDDALFWKDDAFEKFCSLLSIEYPEDFNLDFYKFVKGLPFDAIALTDTLVDKHSTWLKAYEAFINCKKLSELSYKCQSDLENSKISKNENIITSKSELVIDYKLITHAQSTCESSLQFIEQIKTNCSIAYDWSLWDILGGAPKSTALKIEQVQIITETVANLQLKVQELVWYLELINKSPKNILRVNIAEFETFSDRFFDAFVSDLICLTPFPTTQKELERINNELTSTNNYLKFGMNATVTTIETI